MRMKCEKVLVTGGSGFIGSHLIPELVKLEYDVYSLERYVLVDTSWAVAAQ